MPDNYSFFFSYTRADHEFAKRENPAHGTSHNLLDCFFEQLRRVVSGRIGTVMDTVAFRDDKRIGLCEIWPETLTDALQSSSTLITIITPTFLKSENCGREMKFFMDRYDEYKKSGLANNTHPIIPIFWENSIDCNREIPEPLRSFLAEVQFKNEEFPGAYPATGLRKIYSDSAPGILEKICDGIADHIVKLHTEHSLPPHRNPQPFNELPTIFTPVPGGLKCACEPAVATGTGTAQIVYVVGNKNELSATGAPEVSSYSDKPEEWRPFHDAPGATVESATEEGLRKLGGVGCRNWGWPDDLVSKIAEAEEKKSPVLLVVDRASLVIERIKTAMNSYDKTNFTNSALVTAGGTISDNDVNQIFQHKFNNYQQTHLWTVPSGRPEFVDNVADVVGHLKRKLITMKPPGMPPTPVPSLRGPSGS